MRPIENNAAIGRSQDISPLKQIADAKPMVDQQNITQAIDKKIEQRSESVYEKEDTQMGTQYDASKEGRGGYQQNKKKKKNEESDKDGKVVLKRRATFDVKI